VKWERGIAGSESASDKEEDKRIVGMGMGNIRKGSTNRIKCGDRKVRGGSAGGTGGGDESSEANLINRRE
jgi:hypothetical protein